MAAIELLGSIGQATANQFLQTVRYYTAPPGSTFFTPLDTVLENYDPRAQEDSTLNRGDAIEIQGPAASGKTQMLQFFAMTTCLPKSWTAPLSVRGSSRPPREENIAIGGRQKCAIVLDCDNRFSIERCCHLVRSHLTRRVQEHAATIPALYSAETESALLHEESVRVLKRLHLFNPTSSLSLATTLCELPIYIEKNCTDEVVFVMVDNISAFYWQDRFGAEQAPNGAKSASSTSYKLMQGTLQALQDLRSRIGCVVVVTNWAFPRSGDVLPTVDSPFFRQHLPRPYPSPFASSAEVSASSQSFDPTQPLPARDTNFRFTHHLTLHTPAIKAVSRDITVENALKEEPIRQMDQLETGSMGFVRMPGIESGDQLGQWELVVRANVVDGL